MKTRIELITPEQAKSYLVNNFANQRSVCEKHVVHLAQQMTAGQWQLNGEPIIIDSKGNIANGQHRLHAVIRAKMPIQFLIVEGVDESAFYTIDSGKTRSTGDVFAINGITNAKNTAACVNGAMNYRRALSIQKTITQGGQKVKQIGGSLNNYIRPSKIDIMKEYEKHPQDYSNAVVLGSRCKKLASQSIFSTIAALALVDGQNQQFVESFFNSLATGINLAEHSPVYKLRLRLEQNRTSRHKFSLNHAILLTAKAWNYYAMEKPCKLLRIEDEIAFPIL